MFQTNHYKNGVVRRIECQHNSMAPGTAVSALIRALRPSFSSPHDKVVFSVHAVVLADGYTLVGVGESTQEDIPSQDAPEVDLTGWNTGDGIYTFKYTDASGSRSPLLVKCLAVGKRLLVNFLAFGQDSPPEAITVDDVAEYTTDSTDATKGFKNFGSLVDRLTSALNAITSMPKQSKNVVSKTARADPVAEAPVQSPLQHPLPNPLPQPDPRVIPGRLPQPYFGDPGMVGGMGGGMLVGPGDPRFTGGYAHPGIGPPRFDPIAPPGMLGARPGDFQRAFHEEQIPDGFRPMGPRHSGPPGPGMDPDHSPMFG